MRAPEGGALVTFCTIKLAHGSPGMTIVSCEELPPRMSEA
jgi:hypothetical protein